MSTGWRLHYWDVVLRRWIARAPAHPTTTYVPFGLLRTRSKATSTWTATAMPELLEWQSAYHGGKDYGFMEVDVAPKAEYDYEVVMTALLPFFDETQGVCTEFDFRQYKKVVAGRC